MSENIYFFGKGEDKLENKLLRQWFDFFSKVICIIMQKASLHIFWAIQFFGGGSCRWTAKKQQQQQQQNGTLLSFIWQSFDFFINLLVKKKIKKNNELFSASFVASQSANDQHWPAHQTRPSDPDVLSTASKNNPLKSRTAIISIKSQWVKLKYDSFVVKWKLVCVVHGTNNFPPRWASAQWKLVSLRFGASKLISQ